TYRFLRCLMIAQAKLLKFPHKLSVAQAMLEIDPHLPPADGEWIRLGGVHWCNR
ncbi:hypothetical protein HK405_004321, partial [Cladochytrium tenue]